MTIKLFDTTLRDGTQREGVSLTAEDKSRIARELDSLGIDYIEAGFPASNPKDLEFFEGFDASELRRARLVAFTRARRPGGRAEDDVAVTCLTRLWAPVACIVGKSWRLHVEKVLRTTPEENLESVRDTVAYLASAGKEVIFDAEHYFDGFREDPGYALAVLRAAAEAGATTLVLCDTNGGTLPTELKAVVGRTVREFPDVEVGIHTHDDSGCAVANAVAALEAGATHIDTTVLGIGERNGITPLGGFIARMYTVDPEGVRAKYRLERLVDLDRMIADMVGIQIPFNNYLTGEHAFTHKAGIHAKAVLLNPNTYEIFDPAEFGRERTIQIGHRLTGHNAIAHRASQLGLHYGEADLRAITAEIKRRADERPLTSEELDALLRAWVTA